MKLSKRKIFSNKTFFSISSSGATTFQGDWFTENLQHVVVCYTPRVKCDEKKRKERKTTSGCWAERRRKAKESRNESLFKGGTFFFSFLRRVRDFYGVRFFFLIQHHHSTPWKTKHTATYTQFFPHRRFCWCFSLFYNFCCFYFHSAAVQPAFDSAFFFLSVQESFFFGAKSFTNFYSLFIRVRTTTAKSCSRAVACRCLILTDFCAGWKEENFSH